MLATLIVAAPTSARAKTLCTIVSDAVDGKVLLEQGDCRTRVTPASTFKIPLAVMGFDSGILKDAHSPILPFKVGYPDWGGENWKQPTDPTRWLKYSVVWYSQLVTHQLGETKLTNYVSAFGFGNADFSGDPGKANGLDRGWIMSSLKVSPLEQVIFLRRLVGRQLPVAPEAMEETLNIVETSPVDGGWNAHGKTGAAFPRNPDGTFDEAHGYGWYVGWVTKANRTILFAHLDQDERMERETPGIRARAAFIEAWPSIAAALAR